MHVSRSDPDFSIITFQPLPDMQATLPALGIHCFLNNLKIDMICGMKETNDSRRRLRVGVNRGVDSVKYLVQTCKRNRTRHLTRYQLLACACGTVSFVTTVSAAISDTY